MSPHRNRLEGNVIEDNGRNPGTAGIRVRGEPSGLVFEGNVIRDTREGSGRTQTVGILVEDRVGPVEVGTNRIEAGTADRRPAPGGAAVQVSGVMPRWVEEVPGIPSGGFPDGRSTPAGSRHGDRPSGGGRAHEVEESRGAGPGRGTGGTGRGCRPARRRGNRPAPGPGPGSAGAPRSAASRRAGRRPGGCWRGSAPASGGPPARPAAASCIWRSAAIRALSAPDHLRGHAVLDLHQLQGRRPLLGAALAGDRAVGEAQVLELPVEVDVGVAAGVEVAEEAVRAAAEPAPE